MLGEVNLAIKFTSPFFFCKTLLLILARGKYELLNIFCITLGFREVLQIHYLFNN